MLDNANSRLYTTWHEARFESCLLHKQESVSLKITLNMPVSLKAVVKSFL